MTQGVVSTMSCTTWPITVPLLGIRDCEFGIREYRIPIDQNVTPNCTWYARGVTKCVPLNVERKL